MKKENLSYQLVEKQPEHFDFSEGHGEKWDIPLDKESSVWPSAGGLVPARCAAVCGLGPAVRGLYTPQEAVLRISLMQRTLLLAQFLVEKVKTL